MAGMYPELFNIISIDARPFNLRQERYPELIFVPRNEDEIVAIFREARKHKKKVAARGGGHSYASYGLGGENGAWVIDLQQFDKVEVDDEGRFAYIGAGNRLGRVALQLYDKAKKAIPHGLCPRVGVAGHSLHGGFGFTSRYWGLALDSIQAVHVVLPNGRKIWASDKVEPDLFWALLGAGSSFGIVTEFKMRLRDAPEHCIHYWYTWKEHALPPKSDLLPDKETLIKVHKAFQEFAHDKNTPAELAVRMRILKNYMEITGAFWGTYDKFQEAIEPLLRRWREAGVPPDTELVKTETVKKPGSGRFGRSAVHQRHWKDMLLYMANDDHLERQERVLMDTLPLMQYRLLFLDSSLDEGLASWKPLSHDDKLKELDHIATAVPDMEIDESAKDLAEGKLMLQKTLLQLGNHPEPLPRTIPRTIGLVGAERDDQTAQLIRNARASINDAFFATSLLIKDRIDDEASQRLFTYIDKHRQQDTTTTPDPEGFNWFLLIDVYGGEKSNIRNGANRTHSCYSFRDFMFTMQFYINVDKNPRPHSMVQCPDWDKAIGFLHGMRDTVMKNTDPNFKAYMCYIDPEDRLPNSKKPLPASYYYQQKDYERLKKLKEEYEPDFMLWNPQSIGAEDVGQGFEFE